VPARLGTIQTDPDRLKEIIGNLLGNAVKYTDKGLIRLGVREDRVTDSIIIEVADTGMGIPEECLATIFEPFVQVHKTSTENSRGGIGLGLSIVKRHVEQINGAIGVESELGKGSVFRVTLPRIYDTSVSRYTKILRFFRLAHRDRSRRVVAGTPAAPTQAVQHITDT
jgi:signal transduction histidine kinase